MLHEALLEHESRAAEADEDPGDPGQLEAGPVHELLKALHVVGNEVRLRFLDALRLLLEGRLYYELGYGSFDQYCDRELGLPHSTAHEYTRVARAFDRLPRTRALFGQGELAWEQARAITRVATGETETAWIELAIEEPVRRLLAEVREAQRTGRDRPRERRFGLPNLLVRLCFEMTLEEKKRVMAAFAMVGVGGGAAGREPGEGAADDARSPLVRWADGILSGEIPTRSPSSGERPGRPERAAPAQTLLYRTCPECRRTVLDTEEGPICLEPERADELAPVCQRVLIRPDEELAPQAMPDGLVDAPNSSRLTRQVLCRDGLRCANPACGRRRNLQAHHIVHRSRGGRTTLRNEVAVCDVCHALLHEGLLEVTGSPEAGLTWRRRPRSATVSLRDVDSLKQHLHALPTGPVIPASQTYGRLDSAGACAVAPDDRWRLRDLAVALRKLGFSRQDSEERVAAAFDALVAERPPESSWEAPFPDEADILMRALHGSAN